jgi:hypothetical protein
MRASGGHLAQICGHRQNVAGVKADHHGPAGRHMDGCAGRVSLADHIRHGIGPRPADAKARPRLRRARQEPLRAVRRNELQPNELERAAEHRHHDRAIPREPQIEGAHLLAIQVRRAAFVGQLPPKFRCARCGCSGQFRAAAIGVLAIAAHLGLERSVFLVGQPRQGCVYPRQIEPGLVVAVVPVNDVMPTTFAAAVAAESGARDGLTSRHVPAGALAAPVPLRPAPAAARQMYRAHRPAAPHRGAASARPGHASATTACGSRTGGSYRGPRACPRARNRGRWRSGRRGGDSLAARSRSAGGGRRPAHFAFSFLFPL